MDFGDVVYFAVAFRFFFMEELEGGGFSFVGLCGSGRLV
jgi:hypothetical protein